MSHDIFDPSGRKIAELRSRGDRIVGQGLAIAIFIPILLILMFILPFWALVDPSMNPFDLDRNSSVLNHFGLALFGFFAVTAVILLILLSYQIFTGRQLASGRKVPVTAKLFFGTIAWSTWWIASAVAYVRAYVEWMN